ncbi:hypothetical protein Tco_0081416, partial [Tanacetum coccineum]
EGDGQGPIAMDCVSLLLNGRDANYQRRYDKL